jgi:hypothetical protein
LWSYGSLTALVPPGQEMPGGGKLASVLLWAWNDTGQMAFMGKLEDGTRSVYLLELKPDGKLLLVLNSDATTEQGRITNIGGHSPGISLNNKGQVAVAVEVEGGPDTIVLLTPAAP